MKVKEKNNNIVFKKISEEINGFVDKILDQKTLFKDKNVVIHTPLMWLTKSEEFRMAEELGILDLILKRTLT